MEYERFASLPPLPDKSEETSPSSYVPLATLSPYDFAASLVSSMDGSHMGTYIERAEKLRALEGMVTWQDWLVFNQGSSRNGRMWKEHDPDLCFQQWRRLMILLNVWRCTCQLSQRTRRLISSVLVRYICFSFFSFQIYIAFAVWAVTGLNITPIQVEVLFTIFNWLVSIPPLIFLTFFVPSDANRSYTEMKNALNRRQCRNLKHSRDFGISGVLSCLSNCVRGD
jgi:hypothetical protein